MARRAGFKPIAYTIATLLLMFLFFMFVITDNGSSFTQYAMEQYGEGVYPPSRMFAAGEGAKPGAFSGDSNAAIPPVGMMGKLANETARAELGRASWKLMHLMTLRYPKNPTQSQKDMLKQYFYLTAQLYPCGECASEFQSLLRKYPPQTSSKDAASQWLCFVHNIVNERLKKPQFDCAHDLDSTYDCGCSDDDKKTTKDGTSKAKAVHLVKENKKALSIPSESDLEEISGGSTEGKYDDITGIGMIKGG